MITKNVDDYFIIGCGRCALGGTSDCKVHLWEEELALLREIVVETGLTEQAKWGMPCYSWNDNNVLIISAFKEYCSINFFKGVLLADPHGILEKQGENAQQGRIIRFTNTTKIIQDRDIITQTIFEAIEIEKSGIKIPVTPPEALDMPEELTTALFNDPALKAAWDELTPGRKKGYIFFISGAKQSKTRWSRIEKYIPLIFEGKGIYD